MKQRLLPDTDEPLSNGAVLPGPRGIRLLWTMGRLITDSLDPLDRLAETARTYGDLIRFGLGSQELILLNHPDYLRHVLVTHQDKYARTEVLHALRPLLGDGLFTSDPETWKAQRHLLQPAFHPRHLDPTVSVVHEEVRALLARWEVLAEAATTVDIEFEMRALALNILTRTLFASEVTLDGPRVMEALDTVLAYASIKRHALRVAWWTIPKPLRPPTPGRRPMEQALRVLDEIVADVIARCRADRDAASAFMNLLLDAQDAGDIPARQVRDEMMTLLLAGFDTVAQTLAWTWYLLALHPNQERRFHAELDALVDEEPLPLEALDQLPYGRMVLLETMRLYPPAWAIFRVSTAPDVIGGYPIPAQSYIMISPYLMHRHPDFWEHEHTFIPERFDRDDVSDARTFHYLPFGHGPHTCVGKRMALVESQTILALIARSFRLKRTTTEPVNVVPGIIIRAKETIWMTPERRRIPVVFSSE